MGSSRRVLITGIGLVTPLGATTHATWSNLICGQSGITNITTFDATSLPVQIAGTVPTNDLPPSPKLLTPTPRYARFALHAANAAVRDAGLPDGPMGDSAGASIGVGMSAIEDVLTADAHLRKGASRRVSPFLIPRMLPNTPASLVSLAHGLRGPCLAPSTACAAGLHAVLDGATAITRGEADIMLVGGSEAAISPVAVAGFARARALSTRFNNVPHKASRPFDVAREGFVIAEGAGILVLEAEKHAVERGVSSVYAEISGTAATADAFHVTAPHPEGVGALRAMALALQRSGLQSKDVDYVNAHATSTRVGDAVERLAIARLLAKNVHAVVSATKGATGHLLGAAGAVEAAFTALTVASGRVAPTVNLESLDPYDLVEELGWGDVKRYVPTAGIQKNVDVALSNSFGFGGTNACVVLTKPPVGFLRRQMEY